MCIFKVLEVPRGRASSAYALSESCAVNYSRLDGDAGRHGRHAGVAASTVSCVLSGKRPVSEETRERVARSIRLLGYHPHAGARDHFTIVGPAAINGHRGLPGQGTRIRRAYEGTPLQ